MKKLRLSPIGLTILTLVGCGSPATDPAKFPAGKPGAAQTQPAASDPAADAGRERGNGGGY
jgi:hypothetical protein